MCSLSPETDAVLIFPISTTDSSGFVVTSTISPSVLKNSTIFTQCSNVEMNTECPTASVKHKMPKTNWFVDDVFLLWNGTKEELTAFVGFLHSTTNFMRFEVNSSVITVARGWGSSSSLGFESILEGLFGPGLMEDLSVFKDCEPEGVSDWSFDENCLFCCFRREKVKEHLVALDDFISKTGGEALTRQEEANITHLEKQAEEFLNAVFYRKDGVLDLSTKKSPDTSPVSVLKNGNLSYVLARA
ncbi:uncharacterized protein LOC122797786 [Protopterus annectens]|uniref:uncharacterized protein LOC122797786 n=1 Tax=Protopterus annectens TaxID=7888 RepID=UPI001CF94026|nr:uncharacterized protein LOC122797786 [Protopterus annectens]